MKLSTIVFAAVAAEDKKVPPRHPIDRLKTLTRMSKKVLDRNFGFLPSRLAWIVKFEFNANRMRRNFSRGNQKCGFYDQYQTPHGGPERKRREYDDDFDLARLSGNASLAIQQITTGYRKWAERYISACSGQRSYQFLIERMNKWNAHLQAHLLENYNQ